MKKNFSSEKIAVLGVGLEGRDLINYLTQNYTNITVYDEKSRNELDLKGINIKGISFVCGSGVFGEKDLNNFYTIYRSPGIYRYRNELNSLEKKGVKISSAIKLFFELCPATIIGVTGTKGKGTTSTLIFNILKKADKKVYLAGNIGRPYLSLLSKLKKSDFVVLELSSFQLIDLNKSPHISVVLNITSDHLDWHKSIQEYVDAKSNIVKFQKPTDWAVINDEYKIPKSFSKETRGNIIFFNRNKLEDIYKKDLILRGEHNLENIAAAVSVAKILNIDEKIIIETVKNFKGLEHRLEFVREVNRIRFYNDSFATGPQPTIAAIKSFTEDQTLILGGSDKRLDYKELGKVIEETENVKNIILIGQIRDRIKKFIKTKEIFDLGFSEMKTIVKKAFEITPKGGVVILSPASASFDMFKDYKDRGNQFKEVVRKLEKSRL